MPIENPAVAGEPHISNTFSLEQPLPEAGGTGHAEETIPPSQESISRIPGDETEYARILEDLGHTYEVQYFVSGKLSDLNAAIENLEKAFDGQLAGHRGCEPSLPASLAGLYAAKFKKTTEPECLDSAIQLFERAILLTRDDAIRSTQLQCLKSFYEIRFDDELLRNERLGRLGDSIYEKAARSEDLALINTCIQMLQGITKANSPYLTWIRGLHTLALAYDARWKWGRGNIEDLDTSINLFEHHLTLTSRMEYPTRHISLIYLGGIYKSRFDAKGDTCDLQASLDRLEQAQDIVMNASADTLDRAWWMEEIYFNIFSLKISDGLDESISRYEEAMRSFTQNTASLTHRFLWRLANSYEERFHSVGAISDLDIGIKLRKKIVDLHKDFQMSQNFPMAMGYSVRYGRSKELADLEESLSWVRKSWDPLSQSEPAQVQTLILLGSCLQLRFERLRDGKDIEESIQRYTDALALAKDHNKENQANILSGLSAAYLSKYDTTETSEDLDTAIQYSQEAFNMCPKNHPQLPVHMEFLESVCKRKHKQSDTEQSYKELLHMAVNAYKSADNWNGVDRAVQLRLIGSKFRHQFHRKKEVWYLEVAIQMFKKALDQPEIPVRSRISTGHWLIMCHVEANNMATAYEVAVSTLSLIPQLAPRSLEVSDKQHHLQTVAGIASLALALALEVGDEIHKGIQHLELGRGIIRNSLSDLRLDTLNLQITHPKLAEELTELREELDAPSGSISGDTNPRHSLSQKMEHTLEEIRNLPGFDRFLLSPSEKELQSTATRGPVVIINVCFRRCDALIIEANQIRSLELPDLNKKEIDARVARSVLDRDTLEWMWDAIACPVLNNLGYIRPPDTDTSPWPRILWIPTGILSNLPIHAAGYHYPDSVDTVMDRAISSYNSSVRMLIQGQQRALGTAGSRKLGKAVLIGVQELQYASEEIDELHQLCSLMNLEISRPSPHREKVLDSLADCEVFHFAGHGMVHDSDPSRSSLQMDDGTITVQDLIDTKIYRRGPFLAYLSACNTGYVSSETLVDEGLHLIGSCQLAGFRNVIGTLRAVNDDICSHVAKMTYERIKNGNLSDESVSEGLHHAIRSIRDQWVDNSNTEIQTDRQAKQAKAEKNDQPVVLAENSREGRDAFPEDEEPIPWAPFVYYGV